MRLTSSDSNGAVAIIRPTNLLSQWTTQPSVGSSSSATQNINKSRQRYVLNAHCQHEVDGISLSQLSFYACARLLPLLMWYSLSRQLTSPLGLLVCLSILLLLLNLVTRQPTLNMTTPAATTITTVTDTTTSSILALNLCLLPPPTSTVYRLAHSLNDAMHKLDSNSFVFSSTRYAHVTVVQCYIESHQLPALLHDLQAFLTSPATSSFNPLHLSVGDLSTGPLQEGRYVPSLAIPPTNHLTTLHTHLLSITNPYTLHTPPPNHLLQPAFYTDATAPTIDNGTTEWVATFRENAAFGKYFPHVTLGTCACSEGELQGIQKQREQALNGGSGGGGGEEWVVDRLYVFQLGNTGTVRKQLAEIKFG